LTGRNLYTAAATRETKPPRTRLRRSSASGALRGSASPLSPSPTGSSRWSWPTGLTHRGCPTSGPSTWRV